MRTEEKRSPIRDSELHDLLQAELIAKAAEEHEPDSNSAVIANAYYVYVTRKVVQRLMREHFQEMGVTDEELRIRLDAAQAGIEAMLKQATADAK